MDWLYPIHPKVVHFPIALFLTALALELMSLGIKKEIFHKSALIIFILAAVFTPLVVKTGEWEAEKLKMMHPLVESHEEYAEKVMWGSLLALLGLGVIYKIKPSWFRPAFLIILLVLAVLVGITAHYGGRMVYEYGVGTANY